MLSDIEIARAKKLAPIAEIAAKVGYESEAAFNRAFKREFGMPPATWRRHSRRDWAGLG